MREPTDTHWETQSCRLRRQLKLEGAKTYGMNGSRALREVLWGWSR